MARQIILHNIIFTIRELEYIIELFFFLFRSKNVRRDFCVYEFLFAIDFALKCAKTSRNPASRILYDRVLRIRIPDEFIANFAGFLGYPVWSKFFFFFIWKMCLSSNSFTKKKYYCADYFVLVDFRVTLGQQQIKKPRCLISILYLFDNYHFFDCFYDTKLP